MALTPPLKLTRDQLASFLQDHEQIRQFENLFAIVQAIAPDLVQASLIAAGNAQASANEALAQILTLANDAAINAGNADQKSIDALAQIVSLAKDASINSGNAEQKAIQALDTLGRIANALELIATSPAIQNNNSVVTDYIDLPEDGPHVTQARRVQWNEDDGTVDIGLYGGSVLQVGQESMYRVENNTGSTITNGTVCGAVGVSPAGYVRVSPFQATTAANAKFLLGVATIDIPPGELGYVTEFGFVRDIDTSAFAPGTVLYASGTTPGAFTATPPTTPIPKLIVALCAVQNATTGRVLVRPDIGSSIEDLHDVNVSSPVNGDVLIYDAGQARWENNTLTAGNNIAITNGAGSVTIASNPFGSGTASGANAATFSGTLPTGTAPSTNVWTKIDIGGTEYWIPIWAV